MVRPKLDAEVDDEAPTAATITRYDERHLITYLRLLDAAAHDVPWRKAVRDILRRDPSREPQGAKRCWQSHLTRARWMSEHGYRQLVE